MTRLAAASLLLGGCVPQSSFLAQPPLMPSLRAALQSPADHPAVAPTATASAAAATAATMVAAARDETALPLPAGRAERRFSVVLNNAAPEVLFMALLADTPLSVAVDPAVKGPISISLKDVTLRESLDLLRELHGLEYKVIGRHILVAAAQLQTRIFTVDYPSFNRSGRSELRVLSGSITGSGGTSTPGSTNGSPNQAGGSNGGVAGGNSSQESSRISTAQRNDLWGEIETTIKLIIGDKEGRSVVVSPQTGNIVIRALPREIRAVNEYLDATRISVQRQVMLEAKVVEVQLSDSERTGINWSAFKNGLTTKAVGGMLSPGSTLSTGGGTVGDGLITVSPGPIINAAATAAGSILGLAFQTRNFAAVLDFLGTQGNTQVLSSPRIATMNNQKAVLKVGTDDFFVTSISSTTTAVGNTTATTPNIGVQPFFSGISLDVTPNIDAQGFITLHVHPSVSVVSERTKVINLGTQGSYSLPLASSEINESDAVVRAHDGNIIAIGGLMRQASTNSDSGIPGTEGSVWRKLLGGQTNRLSEKRELVILLKPTIVDPSQEDPDVRRDALQRLLDWTETQPTLKPLSLKSAALTAPTAVASATAVPNSVAPGNAAAAFAVSPGAPLQPSFATAQPVLTLPPETATKPGGNGAAKPSALVSLDMAAMGQQTGSIEPLSLPSLAPLNHKRAADRQAANPNARINPARSAEPAAAPQVSAVYTPVSAALAAPRVAGTGAARQPAKAKAKRTAVHLTDSQPARGGFDRLSLKHLKKSNRSLLAQARAARHSRAALRPVLHQLDLAEALSGPV